ncbi:MAG: rod shape-determining protein MreD [Pseudomonadota bacterium]
MKSGTRLLSGILASLLLAFALTIVPLPEALRALRPDWIALTIVYWVIYQPRRIGLGAAWVSGLLLDTLNGALLGQHALALVLLAYLATSAQQRVRVFPIGQQTVSVIVMLLAYHFVLFWIDGVTGPLGGWQPRVYPLLADAALWPALVLMLNRVRQPLRPGRQVA